MAGNSGKLQICAYSALRVLCLSAVAISLVWPARWSSGADPSTRPAEIRPPFTLTWGETSDRLERMVVLAGGRVVNRRMARGNREAIEVENLPQDGLNKTIFYFKLGALVGAELLYRSESWTEEQFNEKMSELRRLISKTYGDGEPIARSTEKVGTIGVTQTLTGYRWTVGSTNMMLVYFAAKDNAHAFRTISVHYNAN